MSMKTNTLETNVFSLFTVWCVIFLISSFIFGCIAAFPCLPASVI